MNDRPEKPAEQTFPGTRAAFVIGSPRSGTSILAWAVAQHPDMCTGPEADFPYYFGQSGEFDRVWDLCTKREDGWMVRHGVEREEYLACLGLGLDQLFQRRSEGRRWVDSTPANVLVGPRLALLFPNAQFLHIVRDGRFVVSSLMKSGFDHPSAKDFTLATQTWADYVKAGRAFEKASPERVLEVRQERLESEPESVMKDVQEFLGLEHSDKLAEYLRTHRINSSYGNTPRENLLETKPASVPKTPWKDWAASEKVTFSKIAAATMVELGYDTSLE